MLGPESEVGERIQRIRRGLSETDDDARSEGELWEALDQAEEADEAPALQTSAGVDERPRSVVVRSVPQALGLWARYHRLDGAEPVRWLPKGYEHPSAPVGGSVPFKAAELVESTECFLLVERRLRAAARLSPARDAYPVVLPGLPTPFVLLALPTFLASLADRLPCELFPPIVLGTADLTPEERASLDEIEAKYQARYPGSWRH